MDAFVLVLDRSVRGVSVAYDEAETFVQLGWSVPEPVLHYYTSLSILHT